MLITFFRSSSFNAHEDCEQRYYLEYPLGWKGDSNLKADRGSIVHKVLEILAIIKQGQQNGLTEITDESVGTISVTDFDINHITDVVFGNYTAQVVHHNWSEKDLQICKDLVQAAITLNKGMFNPLMRDIVAPELHFDFDVDHDWAAYSYNLPDGNKLEGKLALKGTIDLITQVGPGVYEIVDWKTGKRLNWATGEEKTQEKLQDDLQLRLYHYAVCKMYPDIEQVMITIFYIADGGPFTICFDKSDFKKTEDMLQQKFEYIKKTTVPKLNKTWKCTKLCPFGKTTFEGTSKKPIQEFRRGQVTPIGQYMTKCEQIKFEIQRKGMTKTTEQYTAPGHHIGFYKEPGTIDP